MNYNGSFHFHIPKLLVVINLLVRLGTIDPTSLCSVYSVNCAIECNFIIFTGVIRFYQFFYYTIWKLLRRFAQNFQIQIVKLVLQNLLNFYIFNNRIVLVMNFFLYINRRFNEFSQVFQLQMNVKNKLWFRSFDFTSIPVRYFCF